MERSQFPLKVRRRWRACLLAQVQATAVLVHAGYDLAFAWQRALQRSRHPGGVRDGLGGGEPGAGGAGFFEALARTYPIASHRLWFGVLATLYRQGSPLGATLDAIGDALRQEQERDWQAHLRGLGLKTSLVLALCFFLPALALVFYPLLADITESFQ